jgi:hypothetical protein
MTSGSPVVTDGNQDVAAPARRRYRAHAVRISAVLAGIVNLVVAAVLIGIPGDRPTLGAMPTPEGDALVPTAGALTAHPATSPVAPTPHPLPASAPRAAPLERHATPTADRGRTPPAVRSTPAAVRTAPATVRPTPAKDSSVRPGRKTGRTKTPVARHTATAPPEARPTPPGQTKEPPGQAKEPPGQAKEPPGQAKEPPGQTREPPGQAGKGDNPGKGGDHGHKPDVPPGQAKK